MKLKWSWKYLKALFILSDKKALSIKGHKWFAITYGFFVIYIIKDYIPLQYPFIIFHIPVFIAGSVFPDIFHKTGRGLINHRSGFFHQKFTYLMFTLLSPLIIYYYVISPKYYFMEIPFNEFSLLQGFVCGLLLHGLSDSWTSPLR